MMPYAHRHGPVPSCAVSRPPMNPKGRLDASRHLATRSAELVRPSIRPHGGLRVTVACRKLSMPKHGCCWRLRRLICIAAVERLILRRAIPTFDQDGANHSGRPLLKGRPHPTACVLHRPSSGGWRKDAAAPREIARHLQIRVAERESPSPEGK